MKSLDPLFIFKATALVSSIPNVKPPKPQRLPLSLSLSAMESNSRSNQEPNRTAILSSMPATDRKTRGKVRQVSSRYLASPSIAPSPTLSSSPSSFDTIHFAAEDPEKDRLADENVVVAVQSKQKQLRHQLRNMMALRRDPLRSMNLGEHPDAGVVIRNFFKRKDADDSLCRACTSSCQSLMRLGGSQQMPMEQEKEIGRPFNLSRPPQPPKAKLEMKLGKESKVSKPQEDAHFLRLLENRYLQWRFANARAQVADHARRIAAQKSFYNVSSKMVGLRDSVMMKRIEFEQSRRAKRLATILEPQMPHLDEWTSIEGDYSSSLSGVTEALHDALSRLPISESVNADISEIKVVLDSAVIAVEGSACVEKFLTKAQEMESIILELMKIVSAEKILVEECGDLLSVVHDLQVKECSLRSQLIQVKQKTVK